MRDTKFMIIKERSLYRKFIDWYDKWRHKMNTNHGTQIVGFWERGRAPMSLGGLLIVFLIIFLGWYFDGVWQPIFDNMINDIMTYFS